MKRSEGNPGAWASADAGHAKYLAARAEAQGKADTLKMDVGIERNDLFKSFHVFLLPAVRYRSGHELRCEVVHPTYAPEPVYGRWRHLVQACQGSGELSRWLNEAEDIAYKHECAHRAMGSRFTNGRASYRVSRSHAARCIIINHVYGGYGGNCADKPPSSWAEAAGIRADCALAYAIRERLTAGQIAELANAAAIDYARDIAEGS